jgi:hypothetical protein
MSRLTKLLRSQTASGQDGFILLLTLVEGMVFILILTGIAQLALTNLTAAKRSFQSLTALQVAEAGADAAVFNVNLNANAGGSYTGTTAPVNGACGLATSSQSSGNAVTFINDTAHGKLTYENCVVDTSLIVDPNDATKNRYEKTVYSVGKIYQPATSTAPRAVKRVKLILEGGPAGDYSVETGPGGLVMSNSSTITNGNVYVGGYISMTNTSQIGSAAAPLIINAANYNCPTTAPYTGYPQLCAVGEPISIGNSAHIYGTVNANGQTTTTNMTNPGLSQTSGVLPVTLPTYDRAAQKTRVANTVNGNQSCSGNGTLTFAANTKINGDLTAGNNCVITTQGDLWITGNISFTQKAVIQPSAALTTAPTVMVDGSAGISLSQQSGVAANTGGVGISFITFYAVAGCSPNCSSLTGQELINSMAVTTIDLSNQSLSAGSSFYAYWSAINVGQGGSLGAILAQKIILSNSGSVSFSNTQGASTYSWSVHYYEEMPVPDSRNTN